MVLSTSTLVAVIGVAGLTLRQASLETSQLTGDTAHARILARSGLEQALTHAEYELRRDPRASDILANVGGNLYGLIASGGLGGALLPGGKPADQWTDPAIAGDTDAVYGAFWLRRDPLGEGYISSQLFQVVNLVSPNERRWHLYGTGEVGDARARMQADIDIIFTNARDKIESLGAEELWLLEETGPSAWADEALGNSQRDASYSDSGVAGLMSNPDGAPAPVFTDAGDIAVVNFGADDSDWPCAISLWFYLPGNGSGTRGIASFGVNAFTGSWHGLRVLSMERQIVIRFGGAVTEFEIRGPTVEAGVWHHALICFNHNKNATLHVNGAKAGEGVRFSVNPGAAFLFLGGSPSMAAPLPFAGGSLAHVATFTSMPSEDDIGQLATFGGLLDMTVSDDSFTWLVD